MVALAVMRRDEAHAVLDVAALYRQAGHVVEWLEAASQRRSVGTGWKTPSRVQHDERPELLDRSPSRASSHIAGPDFFDCSGTHRILLIFALSARFSCLGLEHPKASKGVGADETRIPLTVQGPHAHVQGASLNAWERGLCHVFKPCTLSLLNKASPFKGIAFQGSVKGGSK